MQTTMIWLWGFVLLYWIYCLYWGLRSMRGAATAEDYMIAGRAIPIWVYVLAATATSFSGWVFIGHPGLLYLSGFQYAYASFSAIVIPFAGLLFLKRQWLLGKRFGYVTPGEMFGDYFRSRRIRILVLIIALIFSIPYIGIQLRASGFLFYVLTNEAISINAGMILLSAIVILYVASGGLRAVAYVDTLQLILIALGMLLIGIIALSAAGGFGQLAENIFLLGQMDENRTPDGYSHYIAIPGIIQDVSAGAQAQGGAWTGTMILTYMFALMGIQASPAFSMWAYSNRTPRAFAPQQVWASSLGIGFILIIFSVIQGMGGHFLGADTAFNTAHPTKVNNILGPGLGGRDLMEVAGQQGELVPLLIQSIGETAPFMVGLLAVCALAAMQSTAAAYMATAGTMLTRDLILRFINPRMDDLAQKFWARLSVLMIVGLALIVAITSTDALVLLGGLAVAFGFQMWTALIGICYWPWLTRAGVFAGLISGLIAVVMTERLGITWFGIEAWGRWPLTLHSAFWGILFNLPVAIVVSSFTQDASDTAHKDGFHAFLRKHSGVPPAKKNLVPLAWLITIVWFFFGVGPGAVIGNTLFGNPNDINTWVFGLPSIWLWQMIWWALGVGMMWFLAYKMEFSIFNADVENIKPLPKK